MMGKFICILSSLVILAEGSVLAREIKSEQYARPKHTTMKNIHMSIEERGEIIAAFQEIDPRLLFLVDKEHALPADSVPPDLVSLDDYDDVLLLNRKNMQVSALMIDDLLDMVKSAQKEQVNIPISSAYRSYAYQQNLFERAVKNYGREQAELETAIPGHSQHQLGLALDFGSITPEFANTAASKWLVNNAADFGFSLSYPMGAEEITGYVHEIWHYRYIGRTAAMIERIYFSRSQQHMLEFWNNY